MNGAVQERRNEAFARWFEQQLTRRGWNRSDFARATGWRPGEPGSGIYPSQVSRWLLGGRVPEPEQCYLIAEALGEDPHTVLILNGHLSPEEGPEDLRLAGLVAKLGRVALDDERVWTLEALLDGWRRIDQRRRSSGNDGGSPSTSPAPPSSPPT